MPDNAKQNRNTKRLVKRAQQGDVGSFETLCRNGEDSLYRIAASCLGANEADIADAVQRTLISAWRALGSLKEGRYFKTWLIRICINECRQLHRGRPDTVSASALTEETLYAGMRRSGREDEAARAAFEAESQEAFKRLVNVAGPSYAPILVLYYGEGYSAKEIAELLDMTPDAVRQQLSRGRKRIAQALSPAAAAGPADGTGFDAVTVPAPLEPMQSQAPARHLTTPGTGFAAARCAVTPTLPVL